MKRFLKLILSMMYLLCSMHTFAQTDTMLQETIRLEHKPAADIIPLVEPFLVENAVISGEGYKIIVQTSAENLPQIKQLISDLDIPLQQLQIFVSLNPAALQKNSPPPDSNSDADEQQPAASAPLSSSATTQTYRTRGQQIADDVQVIQVLQDRWSLIRTGQAVPVIQRSRNPDGTITESVSYQQVNQGLRIRPHLAGEQVILTIQPFYEAANQTGTGQQLYYKPEKQTETRLGTWISIDTTSGSRFRPAGANKIQSSTSTLSTSLIYLKVDVVP